MGIGDWLSVTQVLEVSVIGYLRVRVLSLGPVFSYVSITDVTKLFWSGDAYFWKQNSTYISSLDFSIPQSLVQTLEFDIVLKLSIVRIIQG